MVDGSGGSSGKDGITEDRRSTDRGERGPVQEGTGVQFSQGGRRVAVLLDERRLSGKGRSVGARPRDGRDAEVVEDVTGDAVV
jgi:hypothetical protein